MLSYLRKVLTPNIREDTCPHSHTAPPKALLTCRLIRLFVLSWSTRLNLPPFRRIVGRKFRKPALFAQALLHHSCHLVIEGRVVIQSNEKLEHLGDKVIGLAAGNYLYQAHPEGSEHLYTQVLHKALSNQTFGKLAITLGMAELLTTRQSAVPAGINPARCAAYADLFEAVVGALYLDGKMAAVDTFLEKCFYPQLDELAVEYATRGIPNHCRVVQVKTPELPRAGVESARNQIHHLLIAQKRKLHYMDEHAGDSGIYTTHLWIDDTVMGTCSNTSQKKSREGAAKEALARLRNEAPSNADSG